jgi:hypothetical protein
MVKMILVCAVMLSSWIACSSDDGSSGTTTACTALCAKQAEAKCPNGLPSDTCVSACQSDEDAALAKYPQCKSQWDKYQSCLSTTSYMCDSFGIPRVQGCETETSAFVTCRNGDGGSTD